MTLANEWPLHTRVTRLHALLRSVPPFRPFFVFSIILGDIYFWGAGLDRAQLSYLLFFLRRGWRGEGHKAPPPALHPRLHSRKLESWKLRNIEAQNPRNLEKIKPFPRLKGRRGIKHHPETPHPYHPFKTFLEEWYFLAAFCTHTHTLLHAHKHAYTSAN